MAVCIKISFDPDKTRVFTVSQSIVFDGFSLFERISYEVLQLVRSCLPLEHSGQTEDDLPHQEGVFVKLESFKIHVKCEKLFSQSYLYKITTPLSGSSLLFSTDGNDNIIWKTNERKIQEENRGSYTKSKSISLSSFLQQRKTQRFSYNEWKYLVQSNISDWKSLDSTITKTTGTLTEDLYKRTPVMDEIANMHKDLDELGVQLDKTEIYIHNLEQDIRRNWLVLHGVFETDNENTLEVVINVVKDRTGLQINPYDVENCHRMGRRRHRNKSDSDFHLNKRPIVIKFANYCKRKELWDHKKHLRGSGLLLTESLTNRRLELLQNARETFGEKSVWSQDGRVMYRRPDGTKVRLNTPEDLKNIISNSY